MLEVKNIDLHYGAAQALRSVSLTAELGEVTCVLVSAGAGISLRSLQKLFTARNSTCSDFMYSLRLDRAARLLHRRKLLRTGQPVSEIAYVCGFRDYTNFARKFRQRFGRSPSSHEGDPA